MEKKTVIKKVVLEIAGKEINLTVDQARELKSLLSDMFGKDVVEKHVYHDWYKSWNYPVTYYASNGTGKGLLDTFYTSQNLTASYNAQDQSVQCSLGQAIS